MSVAPKIEPTGERQRMAEVLRRQKAANIRDGAPSLEVRIARLDRAIGVLIKNESYVDTFSWVINSNRNYLPQCPPK